MGRWVSLAFGLAACGGGGGTPADEAVTWDDVAPTIEARCAGCHQPGGGAPMDLTTPGAAAEWADAVAAATADRSMPPWLATSDGSCGEFADSEALTDEEIARFAAWAEGGARPGRGAPITPPPPPTLPDWDLELVTPTDTPEPEGTPWAPQDEYRCYAFPNDGATDWFFTGSEVLPGNPSIVHHVLLMVVDPEDDGWGSRTNAEEMADLEDDDPRPGWDCLGTVGGTARERAMPVEWAPGQGAVTLPDGLGVRVRPQDVLVVQVHYSMPSVDLRGQSDSTTLHLRTAPTVEREAHFALPDKFIETMYEMRPDTIPAGDPAYQYQWSMDVSELRWYAYQDGAPQRYRLWAVLPHMHGYGSRMSLRLDPADGRKECLVDLPRWDFNWQRTYRYAEPIDLEVGDDLVVNCVYDTTGASLPITPGWGTGTEMCLMGLLVTVEE